MVPNPFNTKQVSRVSLAPQDVDIIVFWTRNPEPLTDHLPELDRIGYRYYFQVTLIGYPRLIDPFSPSVDVSARRMKSLSDAIGPGRIIWRYDPILLSNGTDAEFHLANFEQLASSLAGSTEHCVISIMSSYRKITKRIQQLAARGIRVRTDASSEESARLLSSIKACADSYNITVASCAVERNLGVSGVQPGKCIDEEYIERTFGLRLPAAKDQGQRTSCLCIKSKDIGMYDSCIYGCNYCYATSNNERAKINHSKHCPASEMLI